MVLVTAMIAVKMTPGMVTLSLGIEGVLVILLGLLLSQRSYRITGLLLLLANRLIDEPIFQLDLWGYTVALLEASIVSPFLSFPLIQLIT